MIKVIVNGCYGKMGNVLVKLISQEKDMEVVAGIDKYSENHNNVAGFPVYSQASDCVEKGDIVIDFSHFSALPALIDFCVSTKTPLLTATTGVSGEITTKLINAAKEIPVFQTGNFSVGVNIITKLAQEVVKTLGTSFDVEVMEAHHNKKVDSPSGTAYMIAEAINKSLDNKMNYVYGRYGKEDQRKSTDIGIHAIRGGTISGQHTIMFAGTDEIIEIKHTALSKDIFALGAIRAGKFLVDQSKGFYNMNDILE